MQRSKDAKHLKIVFFGDIVGRLARRAACDTLLKMKSDENPPDFAICNVENASHGFGLTEKNYNELSQAGFDCFTSGNHIWDKKDIFNYIEKADKLIRPINNHKKKKGKGSRIFDINGCKIGVINVLGQTFMSPLESYWDIVKKEIKKIKKETSIVLIDFHAEATAEKLCFAIYCSKLGTSAFLGTHTHIQTSDERIINNMAYITDVGSCAIKDSVIGMEYKTSLKRLSTGIPERYEMASGKIVDVNAVEILIDVQSGQAIDIKRILLEKNYEEKKSEV